MRARVCVEVFSRGWSGLVWDICRRYLNWMFFPTRVELLCYVSITYFIYIGLLLFPESYPRRVEEYLLTYQEKKTKQDVSRHRHPHHRSRYVWHWIRNQTPETISASEIRDY